MELIENKSFDYERALYESDGVELVACRFEGEADGESALKESKNIRTRGCFFDLRYPFWHDNGVEIIDCEMTEKCRAPLWYSNSINISSSKLYGVKALRECENVRIKGCVINSLELGWDCTDVEMIDTVVQSEYFMARSKNLYFRGLEMGGKYSFQYIENALLENCTLNTKDAFWHAKNVRVKNCTIKGEYLGWYSENVTFENCVIIGTQPLCYCKGLTLINCQMHQCDLAFEKSEVEAEITSHVISIKNVFSGKITAPCVDKIICDREKYKGIIETKEQAPV